MKEEYTSERYQELRARTKDFGLRAIRLWQSLPEQTDAQIIGKQLLRCATSVAANYRAACLAKSDKDLLHKLKTCQEEADESTLWIEYLIEANIIPAQRLESLLDESKQLTAIMTAATITISRRLNNIHH
ncbi:MAG: four helix bundle protein [Akkermansia sp.]|nr:four helix bundle protein [Akkermansia sp.]